MIYDKQIKIKGKSRSSNTILKIYLSICLFGIILTIFFIKYTKNRDSIIIGTVVSALWFLSKEIWFIICILKEILEN